MNTDILFEAALGKLTKDREGLNSRLEEQAGTEIGIFMNRALKWRIDSSKSHLLSELFNEAVDMSELGFMGSFCSFVGNCLLDDSAIWIEWRKNFVDENHDLVWDHSRGGWKTVLTDKNDSRAQPVVVIDNDGTQDVSLLMEAMDHKEWEVKQREEMEAKKNELLKKIRG